MSFMPKHFRESANRIRRSGYQLSYSRNAPNSHFSSWIYRESLDAHNEDFTKLRLTLTWMKTGDPDIEWFGSVRDADGSEMKLFDLKSAENFWEFTESGGRCPCGKKIFSQKGARLVVDRSTKKRVLEGQINRRENRVYSCHILRDLFHVTGTEFRI